MQEHKGPIVMEIILGVQVVPSWLFRMRKSIWGPGGGVGGALHKSFNMFDLEYIVPSWHLKAEILNLRPFSCSFHCLDGALLAFPFQMQLSFFLFFPSNRSLKGPCIGWCIWWCWRIIQPRVFKQFWIWNWVKKKHIPGLEQSNCNTNKYWHTNNQVYCVQISGVMEIQPKKAAGFIRFGNNNIRISHYFQHPYRHDLKAMFPDVHNCISQKE